MKTPADYVTKYRTRLRKKKRPDSVEVVSEIEPVTQKMTKKNKKNDFVGDNNNVMIKGVSKNKKKAVGSKKSKFEQLFVVNGEGNNKKIALGSNLGDDTAEEEKKMPPVSKVLGINEVMEEEGKTMATVSNNYAKNLAMEEDVSPVSNDFGKNLVKEEAANNLSPVSNKECEVSEMNNDTAKPFIKNVGQFVNVKSRKKKKKLLKIQLEETNEKKVDSTEVNYDTNENKVDKKDRVDLSDKVDFVENKNETYYENKMDEKDKVEVAEEKFDLTVNKNMTYAKKTDEKDSYHMMGKSDRNGNKVDGIKVNEQLEAKLYGNYKEDKNVNYKEDKNEMTKNKLDDKEVDEKEMVVLAENNNDEQIEFYDKKGYENQYEENKDDKNEMMKNKLDDKEVDEKEMVVLAENNNDEQIEFYDKKGYENQYEENILDGSCGRVFIQNLGEKERVDKKAIDVIISNVAGNDSSSSSLPDMPLGISRKYDKKFQDGSLKTLSEITMNDKLSLLKATLGDTLKKLKQKSDTLDEKIYSDDIVEEINGLKDNLGKTIIELENDSDDIPDLPVGISNKFDKQFKQYEELTNIVPSNKPVFLHEPSRANLSIQKGNILPLRGKFMLETGLIDYLIKRGIEIAPDSDILVPSSAVENIIDHLMERADRDKEWFVHKREEYQYFSLKKFNIFICACTRLHFFVIKMEYDPTDVDGHIFKNVTIYDSLKRVTRQTNNVPITRNYNNSPATIFLQKFQQFFAKFVLYGTDFETILLENKDYILKNVMYNECPQQDKDNYYDCSLFAVGVLLHIFYRKVIAKSFYLHHKGVVLAPFGKNGQKWKESRQGELKECIEHVTNIKSDYPVPRDIMKANNVLNSESCSYQQAWRALDDKKKLNDTMKEQVINY